MPTHQDWRGCALLNVQLACAFNEPLLSFGCEPLFARNPICVPPQRVRLRHAIQKLKLAATCETTKCAVANFVSLLVKLARLQMVAHKRYDLRPNVVAV